MEQFDAHHRWPVGFVCVCATGLAFSILLAVSTSTPLLPHSWLHDLLFSNPNSPSLEELPAIPLISIPSPPEPFHSIAPSTEVRNVSSKDLLPSSKPPSTEVRSTPTSSSPPATTLKSSHPPPAIRSPSPKSLPPLGPSPRTPTSDAISTCDISVGKWVLDDRNYPLYRPGSCPYVDEAFNCQGNGRPDSDYLKWRWKPDGCDLPRFNAQNILEKLRGKRMVFVGDSLMRNQWESMLCLLREGLANKNRMLGMIGKRISKGKRAYEFKFLDYNARVEFYGSHFLVDEGSQGGGQRLTLRLDTIDKASKKWQNADVLIFTTGHWWSHSKTAAGKDYFQEGQIVYKSLPVMVAFEKAMKTWASWIDKNVNTKRTKVFFCGYSPTHFNGGRWNSGGHCNDEKEPIFNESFIPSYPEKMLVIEDIVRHMKKPVQILNVTRFSEFRKDGHPSGFVPIAQDHTNGRHPRQDCSHWCLPGVPDIWNEVVHAFFVS